MNKTALVQIETDIESENTYPISLLETGVEAFPEIIRQIRSARQEIMVHMFIWREDRIGAMIASELLEAADRGISIIIEKDRYGLMFEYGEESRHSFCHSPDLLDRFEIMALRVSGGGELFGKALETDRSILYRKLKEHPNVMMMDSRKTKDHSKYYIFDRRIMILGGINIEDKEYFRDYQGRVYFDYMVRIADADIVSQFLEKKGSPQKKSDLFRLNTKEPARCFELKKSFLELIDGTENELTVMMAYFAPQREIMSAIRCAMQRGVSVRILISSSSNFMNDANRLTVSKLLKDSQKSKGKLSVFMTDYMLHAKLMMNEKRIIVGSCNINHRAFSKLGELDIAAANDDSPFARQVRESAEKVFSSSTQIDDCSDIRFNHLMAAAETVIM